LRENQHREKHAEQINAAIKPTEEEIEKAKADKETGGQ